MRNSRTWAVLGAISAFVSIVMGAFGAHGLEQVISPKSLEVLKTGAQYQMYHALALVALSSWSATHASARTSLPGGCFALGTLLFSGSLYALALSGIRAFGAITPFGGLTFMIGWIAWAVLAYRSDI